MMFPHQGPVWKASAQGRREKKKEARGKESKFYCRQSKICAGKE